MTEPLCPFCASPLSESVTNKDHIFSEALGAHQTVETHASCNSRQGSDVEGPLLKPGGYLNLLRHLLGTAQPMPGSLPDGTEISSDLTLMQLDFQSPVHRDATRGFTVSGSRSKVAALLKRQGLLSSSEREALLDAAESRSESGPIEVAITLKIDLVARYIAKVALASLAFVDARSPKIDIATKLIDVLDVRANGDVRWAPGDMRAVIENYDSAHRQLVAYLSPDDVLRQQQGVSQIIFVPIGESCLIDVAIAGTSLPQMLVTNTEMPYDARALLVRDAVGGAAVRRLSRLV